MHKSLSKYKDLIHTLNYQFCQHLLRF